MQNNRGTESTRKAYATPVRDTVDTPCFARRQFTAGRSATCVSLLLAKAPARHCSTRELLEEVLLLLECTFRASAHSGMVQTGFNTNNEILVVLYVWGSASVAAIRSLEHRNRKSISSQVFFVCG